MQVSAKLRYARISPQKCRLVADLVRGRPVGSALGLLKFTPQKGAEPRRQRAKLREIHAQVSEQRRKPRGSGEQIARGRISLRIKAGNG